MPKTRYSIIALLIAVLISPSLAQQAEVAEHDGGDAKLMPTEYSESEYRVSNALSDETVVDVANVPLSALLIELGGIHRIKFEVDKHVATEMRIHPDQPVDLSARHVPLREAIERLTNKLKLSYIVRDGTLLLTSPEKAARERRIKVIMLPQTLDGHEDKIMDQVTRSVEPQRWKSRGGNYEIKVVGTRVTIIGNERLFQKVGLFLEQMQKKTPKPVANTE